MAKMTIAQIREKQLENFNALYIKDEEKAKKIINSFYRLCGLDEWLVYAQNDEKRCNSSYTHSQEEKALRWIKRLNGWLEPYGLKIAYAGIYPMIAIMEGSAIARVVYQPTLY